MTLNFGKYAGRHIREVPLAYLAWLLEEGFLSPPHAAAVREEVLLRLGVREPRDGSLFSGPDRSLAARIVETGSHVLMRQETQEEHRRIRAVRDTLLTTIWSGLPEVVLGDAEPHPVMMPLAPAQVTLPVCGRICVCTAAQAIEKKLKPGEWMTWTDFWFVDRLDPESKKALLSEFAFVKSSPRKIYEALVYLGSDRYSREFALVREVLVAHHRAGGNGMTAAEIARVLRRQHHLSTTAVSLRGVLDRMEFLRYIGREEVREGDQSVTRWYHVISRAEAEAQEALIRQQLERGLIQ
jgi:hypothetical protein